METISILSNTKYYAGNLTKIHVYVHKWTTDLQSSSGKTSDWLRGRHFATTDSLVHSESSTYFLNRNTALTCTHRMAVTATVSLYTPSAKVMVVFTWYWINYYIQWISYLKGNFFSHGKKMYTMYFCDCTRSWTCSSFTFRVPIPTITYVLM